MASPFRSGIGEVVSADIAVPEHEREVQFYSRVLTTGEEPLWRDDLMNAQGTPVIGLGARTADFEHLPVQWMPHIQVADVAASAVQAVELGGTELMHGKDEGGVSEWAVLRDPQGAAFGIIPVVSADALPVVSAKGSQPDGIGHIRWLDLTVQDAPRIRDFYRRVIGWSVEEVQLEHNGERYVDYARSGASGSACSGICHAKGANSGLPSTWLLYLPVGDFAESLRRVKDEGGVVVKSTADTGDEHTYAIIRDPVGVHFAIGLAQIAI